jgi:hypothetical protein
MFFRSAVAVGGIRKSEENNQVEAKKKVLV